jgi:hypothetical protein
VRELDALALDGLHVRALAVRVDPVVDHPSADPAPADDEALLPVGGAMAKFIINKEYENEREVEASHFRTVGEFIDFESGDGIVLRIRASSVETVHQVFG